jgi:hypothetical protein
LITISIDDPQNRTRALNFLKRQHAALPDRLPAVLASEGRTTDNYLYTGKLEALQATLDPQWPGPVPYTVIVAPGGQIVYRHVGVFDPTEVRAKLIDALSPYYDPKTGN